jgi:hypothetical protein
MPEIRVNDAELFYVDQDLDCDAAPRAVQNPGIARLNTRSGWPGARTSRLCSKKQQGLGLGAQPRSGSALSLSRTQRHFSKVAPQSTSARGRRALGSTTCFPAAPVAPRSAAAMRRQAYVMPHGFGRAR